MKKIFIIIILLSMLSCNDDTSDTNSFLPNRNVNLQLDLNLPLYSDLQIMGEYIELNENIGGIRGLIIYNTGTGFVAFDRACPHISLQECGVMNVEGIYMVCACDDKRFQIIDGAPEDSNIPYPARAYIATLNGNILNVRN